MKKVLLSCFAALLGAVLFFSCSNGSDNPASFVPNFPPKNDFNGKTFTGVNKKANIKISFSDSEFTMTKSVEYAAVDGKNTAYLLETFIPYSYQYSSITKQMFYKYNGSGVEERVIRNGNVTVLSKSPVRTYKDDADFVSIQTERNKALYDLVNDAGIESMVKSARKTTFQKFGYADNAGETAVSAEIIEKYNKVANETLDMAKNDFEIYAYEFSGAALKIKEDTRAPAGKSLKEIFDNYAIVLRAGNSYSLRKKVSNQPDIANSDSSICYKVSEVTDSEIKVLGEMTNSSGNWVLTNNAQAFKYTTTKTGSSASFEVETLGTINVDYATANNVPDMADAIVCSLVQ